MTKSLFRVDEVLGMAVQIEYQGLAFYRACKEEELGPEIEKVLDFLITQEERHVRIFTRMKADHEEYRLPESYAGEMSSYLDAFVKEKVFQKPEKASKEAKKISGPLQAVDWGVSFERRSIEFYRGIKNIVREAGRETMDTIIAEEQNHIRRLSELGAKIKDKRDE